MTTDETVRLGKSGEALEAEGRMFWDQLLQLIEEERVIPIVGPDLFLIAREGRSIHLYQYLAERLVEYLDLDLGDATSGTELTLNEVAYRHLGRGGELDDLYGALKAILANGDNIELPAPLLKLASIRHFKLFITTTFDSLLEQAINQQRFGGAPRTTALAYSPQRVQDLPAAIAALREPVVFHLMGKVSAVQDYAVTDEDALEFIYSLQSENRRPELLFDELSRGQLLIIGSRFPGWLTRFFLRIARRERLWMARGKTLVAGRMAREDKDLLRFLKYFAGRTKVYGGGDAIEFVDELHQRWTERHGADGAATPAAPSTNGAKPATEMEMGAIFLSYASEDLSAAEAISRGLEEVGVDVWFDRKNLDAGDGYEDKIRRNIEQCSFFVPIISQHTRTPRPRFFRKEWHHAEGVAQQLPPATTFIVPVAIDDTPPEAEEIPLLFRRLHWQRLPDGRVSEEFANRIRNLFREYQRSIQRAR